MEKNQQSKWGVSYIIYRSFDREKELLDTLKKESQKDEENIFWIELKREIVYGTLLEIDVDSISDNGLIRCWILVNHMARSPWDFNLDGIIRIEDSQFEPLGDLEFETEELAREYVEKIKPLYPDLTFKVERANE
jgi:hypothetical protein